MSNTMNVETVYIFLLIQEGPYFQYLKAFWPVLCILINTGFSCGVRAYRNATEFSLSVRAANPESIE
jgi:hypothetical protein